MCEISLVSQFLALWLLNYGHNACVILEVQLWCSRCGYFLVLEIRMMCLCMSLSLLRLFEPIRPAYGSSSPIHKDCYS